MWHSPLALPYPLRYSGKGGRHAVYMARYVTVLAQHESPLIVAFTAALAHRAVQAPPPLLQHNAINLHGKGRC